jgi:HPt (histidine-containing phosphotransfer) domain-containing protein
MMHNTDSNRTEKIIVRVDEDLADLIPGFLNNRQQDIKIMNEGLEGGDYETVRTVGHSMKGSGGGYGFDGITEIGRSLEIAAQEQDTEKIREWLRELSYYLEIVEVTYDE